ncbi:hypothetical protein C8A03DRAFT_16720 [Achaetomium macrosporum]|uniref:Uncharacterized protein n=1 Tax=Achaetomium macrosporum TaxID=79813 RepID=A0AAN7HCV4_9PEZI|nr:hypothetical protein C8A03DRAFT_16720 [Achaetomium macrosporum]
MCTLGYNHFACGCAEPIPRTLVKCEWAKLKGPGYVCPFFQISEDTRKSRTVNERCMAHF